MYERTQNIDNHRLKTYLKQCLIEKGTYFVLYINHFFTIYTLMQLSKNLKINKYVKEEAHLTRESCF